MISGLSNNQDFGGRTALVEYTNDGTYVATYDMPTDGNQTVPLKQLKWLMVMAMTFSITT